MGKQRLTMFTILAIAGAVRLSEVSLVQDLHADAHPRGLSPQAFDELKATGMNKYLGKFTPIQSEPFPPRRERVLAGFLPLQHSH
jgi:hypothetical protein